MAQFMFLFRNDTYLATRSMSPEQMQQVMQQWMGWMETLTKNGHIQQAGERLDSTGKVVRGKNKTVTDGPYAESKDTIAGYVIIDAKDLDQAVELSKGCPILDADGTVEIRPTISM